MIDRIDLVDLDKSILARKLTSNSESYWQIEDGRARMPNGLILEALCQAGSWLIMVSSNFTRRGALLCIDSVTFGSSVSPGDVLELRGRVDSIGPETAVLSGTVSVNGTVVLVADHIMCAVVDAGDLEDADAIREMHRLLTRSTPAAAS